MKSFRAKSGPSKIQTYIKISEVENMCVTELKALNLLPENPEPIRVDRFVEKRFNIIIDYQPLPSGLLGFTQFGPRGIEGIVITQALDEEGTIVSNRRVRTTIAHEAGHALLHTHLFATEKQSKNLFGSSHDNTPRVLCRDTNEVIKGSGKGYKGDWWEFQANMVMGVLLMPRVLVEKALKPYLETRGLFGSYQLQNDKRDEAVKALSEIFDVNPVVVRIRLSEVFPLTNAQQQVL